MLIGKPDRLQLRKAIAQLEDGDVLLVVWLDRLARSTRGLLEYAGGLDGLSTSCVSALLTERGQSRIMSILENLIAGAEPG